MTHNTALIVCWHGKPLSSPQGHPVAVPTPGLHKALEDECAQDSKAPHRGPMIRCAMTALDRMGPEQRCDTLHHLLAALATDMLCFRDPAAHPDLQAAQAQLWNPVLAWFETCIGPLSVAPPSHTPHLTPLAVPTETLARMKSILEELDTFTFMGVTALHTLVPSLAAVLAVERGQLSPESLATLSLLEEEHQASVWGHAPEADARRHAHRQEILALAQYLQACVAA